MSVSQTDTNSKLSQSNLTQQHASSIWKNRNYVILLISGALIILGSKLYELTLPLILYQISHNSAVAMTVFFFFCNEQLHLESSQLGLVLSTDGIGGLIGSLVVGICRRRFRTGHLLGGAIFFLSCAYFIMFSAKGILAMCLALFLEGWFGTILNVCISTFRQESTPSHLIGRISGLTGSIFKLRMVFTILYSVQFGLLIGWVRPTCFYLLR